MLRRFIIIWLVLSIFGYGVALAADVHGEQAAEIGISLDHGDDDGGNHDDTGCHHCSHGISHLLGIRSEPGFSLNQGSRVLVGTASASFDSHSPPSLLRPPINL
ncbi:hypothetical protein [Thiolapillus sp.]